MTMPSFLFVCLGNICRSPLAAAAFRAELRRANIDAVVDSAGTGGWHVDEPPDPRAQAVARKNGIDISGCRARQVRASDFYDFTYILAMDSSNVESLRTINSAEAPALVSLLLDWVPGREGQYVIDPYYGTDDGFSGTWNEVSAAAQSIITHLTHVRTGRSG